MIGALRQFLKERSTEFFVLLILLWLLPFLGLLVFGGIYLYQAGWLLWFTTSLIVLALVTQPVRVFLKKSEDREAENLTHLEPVEDWSEYDHQIWEKSLAQLTEAQLFMIPWEEVPKAMLDHLTFVARLYNKDDPDAEYAFSVPQLLLMLETWSRKYRAEVLAQVPGSQKIKISTLRNLKRKSGLPLKVYKYLGPTIRIARLVLNPAGGIASEISSRMYSELSGGFSERMQKNMKQTLFEQVTQVGIELYSGRLKLSEEELTAYRDDQKVPDEVVIRPLSVLVIGQINAGKSSLVNALKEQSVAEVDVLPSTDGFPHYCMSLTDELEIYLIDSPGLDGVQKTTRSLLKEAVKADLVLWLSQANQPAKGLDKEFLEQFIAYYSENVSRRKPPIVLVSTHNDRLFPAGSWSPPDDLEENGNDVVAKMIEALKYAHTSIGFPETSPMVPISLSQDYEPYNVEVLRQTLLSVSALARAAQLNKERLDAAAVASVVRKGLKQTAGLLKWGVGTALR